MNIYMDSHVSKRKHWFALSTALYYGGKISCLSIFHDQEALNGFPYDQRRLYHTLVQQRPLLESLYYQETISYDEWKVLYPDNQLTDSRNFELGMLIALLHHLVLPPPVNGWMNHPNPHDTGMSLSLLKLREYKDKLAKWENTSDISYEEFVAEWNTLCEILFGLGFNVSHLHPIWEAAQNDTFHFRREYKKEFHRALKDAKIMYFRKTLHELRIFYTRHLDNVVTIMSVVGYQQMEYLQNQALDLKDPLVELEREFDRLSHHRFKTPLNFLHSADVLYEQVVQNDLALDVEIEKHNRKTQKDEMKVRKKTNEDENNNNKRRNSVKASMCKFVFATNFFVHQVPLSWSVLITQEHSWGCI